MELQKSVAEMNATLIATKAAVDGLKSKVDDLIAWKHKILGGAVVLGAVLAFIAFVAGKASEYVTLRPVATAQAPAATLPPQLSATAASK